MTNRSKQLDSATLACRVAKYIFIARQFPISVFVSRI